MFGPKQYLRTTASVDVFTDSFLGVAGNGTVTIQNGDGKGHNLVSDVLIQINGVALADWSKLLQPGYKLEDPISMNENNSILVIILGKPGSYLTIQTQAEITPDATSTQVIGIAGGTVSVENHLGDTFTLTIPPLALDQDTPISISALPNALPSPIASSVFPGAVLEPEGLHFSLPVSMTVSLHGTPQNSNPAMLFWFEDSAHVLPIGKQTATQNSVAGQNFHFSTEIAGAPTQGELALNIAQIMTGGPGMPATAVDKIDALLAIASLCSQLGYDAELEFAMSSAAALTEDAAEAELDTSLPADPCGQNTLNNLRLALQLQQFGFDTLAIDIMKRDCSFELAPPSLSLFVGQTSDHKIVATLKDPNGKTRSCSAINWYNDKPNVAATATSGNACVPSGVGPGVADVSAKCDGLPASTQVKVCGLIGTYQGTYSGETIACTEQGPGGCMKWGKPIPISGAGTLVSTQIGTGVSAVLSIADDPMDATFTGTNIKGKVSVQGTLLCHVPCSTGLCPAQCPAGLSGTLSSDCSTFSGSFYDDRPRKAKGTFTLSLTAP